MERGFFTMLPLIEAALDHYLTPGPATPTAIQQGLWQALRYGVLGGGKRIRSLLLVQVGLACGASLPNLLPAACAVELVHSYSLIHDDLPCMDDDDLRRGQPTVHRAFDEATAVLAGDALRGLAFGILAGQPALPETFWQDNPDPGKPVTSEAVPELASETRLQLLREFSATVSMEGLVNGQYADMHFSQLATMCADPSLSHLQHSLTLDDREEMLTYVHHNKTAALFRFCTRAGATLGAMPESLVKACGILGEGIGVGFQVVDDLLDIHASSEALGKTPGKDRVQSKLTFPSVYGEAGALKYYQQLEAQLFEQATMLQTLLHESFNRPQNCCEPVRNLIASIGRPLLQARHSA